MQTTIPSPERTVPTPHNESERLRTLYDLDILDTKPEERFDRIARLASRLVDAPIALVSLVGRDRQWFKAKVGLDANETGRELAFCAHAIMDSEVFAVPDATKDARFNDNPLVTGAPNIRFYAGAPLTIADGVHIGTLCAIDTKPRQLTGGEEEALRDLSRIVVDELKLRQNIVELRRARTELEQANARLEQFAHIAAHDLRAPMKTLVDLSDIVLTSTGEQRDRGLGMIREAALEAESLVSGYRRLSVLRLGALTRVRVSELLRHARTEVPEGLDVQLHGDAELECDGALMKQVFVNLLQNVQRHGVDDRVSVDCAAVGRVVVLRVTNRPREVHPVDASIFAPFQQLTSEEEGRGLGLSIVHRIAQLHGGNAQANTQGGAFTIEITLPTGDGTL